MSPLKPASLLVVALLWVDAQPAAACKCVRNPSGPPEGSEAAIAADLGGATAVFTGKVSGMQSRIRLWLRIPRYLYLTRGDRELEEEEEDRILRRRVQLKVEESFKGVAVRQVVLYTGWGGGDCGYLFRRGSRYLVYASDYDGGLYTGICLPTKPVEEAGAEVGILRRLADGKSEPVPRLGRLGCGEAGDFGAEEDDAWRQERLAEILGELTSHERQAALEYFRFALPREPDFYGYCERSIRNLAAAR